MEITLNREKAHVFSPFGRKLRAFTDQGPGGKDITMSPGSTLPEMARKFYGISEVDPFVARFSFLDRDNKERTYSPGADDPFVFKNEGSLKTFDKDALAMISHLCEEWTALGLPLKKDPDRGINIPDTSVAWAALETGHPFHSILKSKRKAIMFITSNVDIMKKACVVRGVIPGWWASSYSGQYTSSLSHFKEAIDIVVKADHERESWAKYQDVRTDTANDLADPLDTNTGYPLFSAQLDKAGNPVAKLRLLETYEGIGHQNYNLAALLKEVDRRAIGTGCEGYPFVVAPIRRLQPGYKWSHVMKESSLGLLSDHDERGNNTQRIAWMASYLLNLILSALQLEWKVNRKLSPGLFHDGEAKKHRLKMLKRPGLWVAEADYSNYDRNIPINLFLEWVKGYLANKPNKDYWFGLCHMLHHRIPTIWPDYIPNESGRGWVFYAQKLGLLSGLKITSEEGTKVNEIINVQSLLDAGIETRQSALEYLLQYKNAAVGSKHEHIHIQSDDTFLIADSPEKLFKLGNAFKENADRAGLKGSLEMGDRFLMRQTSDGRDTPVPARVWQNTLSNEEPYTDGLKFLVGLAMRTDGLLGAKTYDPFDTGEIQVITGVELRFTLLMLRSLLKFFDTAAVRQRFAVEFIQAAIQAGENMKLRLTDTGVKMATEDKQVLDRMRKDMLRTLAEREADAMMINSDGLVNAQMQTMIYQLQKQSNTPSAKQLLETLFAANSRFQAAGNIIAQREKKFYRFAMAKLNLPLNL